MRLFRILKEFFVSPKVVECQMCGVSGEKSKMLWGFPFWFCQQSHLDQYWDTSNRFKSLNH